MHNEIPTSRPLTPLLDSIDSPVELRALSEKQLPQLAEELRAFLLYSVGQTGGHFGAGLGVVELTIALHYVYATPDDRLVWDVGHQTYPHKILTSRRERMHSIRQGNGLSVFPNAKKVTLTPSVSAIRAPPSAPLKVWRSAPKWPELSAKWPRSSAMAP